MISGQQALQAVESSSAHLRSQELSLDSALRSADECLAQLSSQRTNLFRKLAQVRLDALQKERIVTELDRAEREAMAIVAEEHQRQENVSRRFEEAGKEVQAAEAQRHAALGRENAALEALEELQVSVEPKVRASAEWLEQKGAVDQAERVAQAADEKARASEADREAKRLPYESDLLFMYLWDRKFGTSDDRSGFLARFFDRKVAALIGYSDARANFAMLNEIPFRLRQHADGCKAAWNEQKTKLVAVEQAGLRAAGAEALETTLTDARASLASADSLLEKAHEMLKVADAERQGMLSGGGASAYGRAIDLLISNDAQQGIRQLMMKAAQTQTSEDDSLLRQVTQLDTKLEEAQQQGIALRRQAQELAERRSELEQQRDTFRRRGYDGPMSQFNNDNALKEVLSGILQGVVQGAVLGNVLRGGHSQRAPRADSGFGGSGGFTLPDFGGNWGGSGDPGGDGFRTGGQF